jgi:hypothetical protein
LQGWDQEDSGSRPAWEDSSPNPISQIKTAKWTGNVAQVVEHYFASMKPKIQTPVPPKK